MAYKPSPRPRFDAAAHIPRSAVTRHLWGDEAAGLVADWCYVSSEKIHQLVFGLPPGGAFRHSTEYKTYFAADELYYVLSGEMALANPETGEVHLAGPGDACFFRQHTWHHAFNAGTAPLRVLEIVAPPPSTGSCGEYALNQPDLEERIYERAGVIGNWPMARDEVRRQDRMRILGGSDIDWRLEGDSQELLVGILASTEHLTVGLGRLLPGRNTPPRIHNGDLCLYVLEGTLNVRVPDDDGPRWFEVCPDDGFYLPEKASYQFFNGLDTPARFVFGVAPDYRV